MWREGKVMAGILIRAEKNTRFCEGNGS